MKEENQNAKATESLSKARKIARKKEIEHMKRTARINKIVSVIVAVVLCVGIVSFAGYKIYRGVTRVRANGDYSASLTEDGKIAGVTASSLVTLPDYTGLKAPLSEIEYSEESISKDIRTIVLNKGTLNKETDATIVDGDKVNIDFVGTIDGKEFNGGNTNGSGSDVVIGSGNMIDDFEQQLIGHKIGDEFDIEVTFPEDYGNEELNGKDAKFAITVNGIYDVPEFTDEFVAENLSDYATTVEGYKEYLKKTNYEKNLITWIEEYLMENSTVSSYPNSYIKHLKENRKFDDQNNYNSLNAFYETYYGYKPMKSFTDFVGMSEAKYDKSLTVAVQDQAKKSLIYQAILEKEGLTVTSEDYIAYLEANGGSAEAYESEVTQYGQGYVMQQAIHAKVNEFMKENITVE